MVENKSDFSIIFEELDKLSKEPDVRLTSDELKEYEEIRTLREIVLEIQSPIKTYLTST
jgi:spore coat polysaccharide biosynthesis protein SpsF (cytidylyltransferase family)